jgi:hypothetical protein
MGIRVIGHPVSTNLNDIAVRGNPIHVKLFLFVPQRWSTKRALVHDFKIRWKKLTHPVEKASLNMSSYGGSIPSVIWSWDSVVFVTFCGFSGVFPIQKEKLQVLLGIRTSAQSEHYEQRHPIGLNWPNLVDKQIDYPLSTNFVIIEAFPHVIGTGEKARCLTRDLIVPKVINEAYHPKIAIKATYLRRLP